MSLQLRPPSLYAAFDRFPSAKGAATHINHFAGTLFEELGGGLLYVLGGGELPVYQREQQVDILRYEQEHPNMLDRTLGFGRRLAMLLEDIESGLELCHFRDPWSGVPIVSRSQRRYRTVYEINALPSVELPYRYPHISPSTLQKIRLSEQHCWQQADAVVTPSQTIAANLAMLGVPSQKITVIPNGAELPSQPPTRPDDAPDRYIIYFGALQRWQGVDVLLRSFARLADLNDIYLVICSSTHRRTAKLYRKLASNLGVDDRIIWHYGLTKPELNGWLSGALLSVAPLTECSRNLQQGCSPLKILESMALGVPVVASDIPAVREIIANQQLGRLVRPDRPAELARAIRVLLEYPERLEQMGLRAREHINNGFTWEHQRQKLVDVYRSTELLTTERHETH